jgi:transposase
LKVAFGEATLIRGLVNDEEWAYLEPFVIERGARSGRRPRDHCLVLDGIFWIAPTGVAWRDLHEHFGHRFSSNALIT